MISSKNKKINFLNKIYIVIAIFSSFVLLIFYTTVQPTINEIERLNKDILNQKIELEKKINQEKNKAQLENDIKKINPEIDLLDKIFLNSNKKLEFITTFEGIANKHNVEQTINLITQKKEKVSSYEIIPLNITVKGRFYDVLEYLKNIESLEYYINIYNININLQELSTLETNTNITKDTNQQSASLVIEANSFWK